MYFLRAFALSLLLLAFGVGCDSMSVATQETIRFGNDDSELRARLGIEDTSKAAEADDSEQEDAGQELDRQDQ
jgi:hypothetical protein